MKISCLKVKLTGSNLRRLLSIIVSDSLFIELPAINNNTAAYIGQAIKKVDMPGNLGELFMIYQIEGD